MAMLLLKSKACTKNDSSFESRFNQTKKSIIDLRNRLDAINQELTREEKLLEFKMNKYREMGYEDSLGPYEEWKYLFDYGQFDQLFDQYEKENNR